MAGHDYLAVTGDPENVVDKWNICPDGSVITKNGGAVKGNCFTFVELN